jgi:malate dehydrogenase (oxaloacetate-decarboxylating)(NADP+)
MVMVDSRGVIYKGRTDGMNAYKEKFACETEARTLADAVRGADVFYGLSVAGLLTPEMVKTMAENPLIFAMANPDPEIGYEEAKAARPDALVATGRSDYPNQINNVLGFPFIFRGALDTRSTAINYEMKIAAAHALAGLAKEDVPDSVLKAYKLERLKFGPEYLIPKPFDPRVLLWVSPAVAKAAMETGVARQPVDLDAYVGELALRQGKGQGVRQLILNKARGVTPSTRLVFGEGENPKIIRAAFQILQEEIGEPVLLGDPQVIQQHISSLGLEFAPEIINPRSFEKKDAYIQAYSDLRQRRGVTLADARKKMLDPLILGPMMVYMGDAEGYLAGLTHEYPEVIRPALQIHHTRPGVNRVAGVYLLFVERRVYFFADTTVNINPTAEELVEIAVLTADLARQLEMEPRVAMLSFSNFGSTVHPEALKVRKAVEMLKDRVPDLKVDGEMQADTAVIASIVDERYPFSAVKDANVLVFPSLDAANISSKLVSCLGKAKTIGPILLGAGAPIHILHHVDDVEDIVNAAALAVMDADDRRREKPE